MKQSLLDGLNMTERIDEVKKIVDSLKEREQRALLAYLRTRLSPHPLETKWGLTADVILGAINRAPDITQRGIRGVIAEAVFETEILPPLSSWETLSVEAGLPYDFKLKERGGDKTATIQVKLQRSERGEPKRGTGSLPKEFFIVEVQRTRTGTRTIKPAEGTVVEEIQIQTRPYSFGDFDILAVNMHPSTNDWSRFMYTVANWLIPRTSDPRLIEIMPPVSGTRSDVWTDSLEESLGWLASREKRLVFDTNAARFAGTQPTPPKTSSKSNGE